MPDQKQQPLKANLPEENSNRWLSVGECAEYLSCHPQSVRAMLHNGELRCARVGGAAGQIRIDRLDLDKFLERSKKFLPAYRKGTHSWVRKTKPWLRSHMAHRKNSRARRKKQQKENQK